MLSPSIKVGIKDHIDKYFEGDSSLFKSFVIESNRFISSLPRVAKNINDTILEQKKVSEVLRPRINDLAQVIQNTSDYLVHEEDIITLLTQYYLFSKILKKIIQQDDFFEDMKIINIMDDVLDITLEKQDTGKIIEDINGFYEIVGKLSCGIKSGEDKVLLIGNIFEMFLQSYNLKIADKLGIVYTPQEIVKFMIRSIDWILKKRFGKSLANDDIQILDPCVGSGNFIIHLLKHFAKENFDKLESKYKNGLYANEIDPLTYCIALVNIKIIYQDLTGVSKNYLNLSLKDSLNFCKKETIQNELFKNTPQIVTEKSPQNISVILGNPPYNASQKSENEANKNKKHSFIDQQIQNTPSFFPSRSVANLKNFT